MSIFPQRIVDAFERLLGVSYRALNAGFDAVAGTERLAETSAYRRHYHAGRDGDLVLMDYAPDVRYYMSHLPARDLLL